MPVAESCDSKARWFTNEILAEAYLEIEQIQNENDTFLSRSGRSDPVSLWGEDGRYFIASVLS